MYAHVPCSAVYCRIHLLKIGSKWDFGLERSRFWGDRRRNHKQPKMTLLDSPCCQMDGLRTFWHYLDSFAKQYRRLKQKIPYIRKTDFSIFWKVTVSSMIKSPALVIPGVMVSHLQLLRTLAHPLSVSHPELSGQDNFWLNQSIDSTKVLEEVVRLGTSFVRIWLSCEAV